MGRGRGPGGVVIGDRDEVPVARALSGRIDARLLITAGLIERGRRIAPGLVGAVLVAIIPLVLLLRKPEPAGALTANAFREMSGAATRRQIEPPKRFDCRFDPGSQSARRCRRGSGGRA
jgi:hypothetical protein